MQGIIISHGRGGSYVLDRDGCFQFVKGFTSQSVGTEIEFKPQVLNMLRYAKVAAMAACLAIVMFLGGLIWLWNSESYSVYVDINPSIELVFNNLNRPKDAKPLNEDGAALLKELSLKGSPEDVVIKLIQATEQDGYFIHQDGLPLVVITVASRGNKAPEQYRDTIDSALERYQMHGFADVEVCNADFRDRAESLGVSPGKLKLAERLFAFDQSVPVDKIVEMSVKDLMEDIKKAEMKGVPASGNAEKEDNPNTGPGNNSGNDNPNTCRNRCFRRQTE